MGALGSDAHLRHRPNAKPAVDLAARWQAQPGRSGDLDGLGTMNRKTGITIDNAPASGVGGRVPPPAVWRGRIAVKSGTARCFPRGRGKRRPRRARSPNFLFATK